MAVSSISLSERAAYLRAAAPVQYNEFIAALELEMWGLMERCALAQGADGAIRVLQGQAQMCKQLVETLKEAGVHHVRATG